jgi:hypothetical protein
MTNDLEAKAKAQAGLWLIQQAILQLIRKHGPKQPHEVGDALDQIDADLKQLNEEMAQGR